MQLKSSIVPSNYWMQIWDSLILYSFIVMSEFALDDLQLPVFSFSTPTQTSTHHLIPSPNEDDSSQFQSTGDVIQHGKRGGLLCRHRWRSDLITMPLA